MTALTPACHMRNSASDTHRACSFIGTPFGSGGFVSQLNSVTKNWGWPAETIVPWRFAAMSSACIAGRSPIDAFPGILAFHVGPPFVYGLWAQMSNWVRAEQVVRYGACIETHSRSAMNLMGATTWMSFESCSNGPRVPAMT